MNGINTKVVEPSEIVFISVNYGNIMLHWLSNAFWWKSCYLW